MLTLHNLYVYDKRGACLYYHEWSRTHNPLADNPDEDVKLVFGLLFSLKQLCQKLEPVEAGAGNLSSFSTNAFTMHQLETVSGIRFVLNTSVCHKQLLKDVQLALRHVYGEIFVETVLKNPLYKPFEHIESDAFTKQLDGYMIGVAKRLG